MFDSNSRYYSLETKLLTTAEGNVIAYKSRRFLPALNSNRPTAELVYNQGERLDLIAASTIGDPLQFWQIADVNNAMHPKSLTEQPGAIIRIPTTAF